jgi:hypothetical protein
MTETEKFKVMIDELIRQWRDDLFTAEEILEKIEQVSKTIVIQTK